MRPERCKPKNVQDILWSLSRHVYGPVRLEMHKEFGGSAQVSLRSCPSDPACNYLAQQAGCVPMRRA